MNDTTTSPTRHGRRCACNSGISLTPTDAARIKGMVLRSDRQHDVAAYHGVDSARVSEVIKDQKFPDVRPMAIADLPPSGPYVLLVKATPEQLRAALQTAATQ